MLAQFPQLEGQASVFSVSVLKSSLHICKFDVGRDFEAEALQQYCLMSGWAADTSFADRDAGACGQHDIDQRDLFELGEDLARFVAKAGTPTPQTGSFPESIGKKADEDMGLDAMFLLAPDGPHDQVALVQSKRFLGFRQLDVSTPEFFSAPVGHVAAPQVTSLGYTTPSYPSGTVLQGGWSSLHATSQRSAIRLEKPHPKTKALHRRDLNTLADMLQYLRAETRATSDPERENVKTVQTTSLSSLLPLCHLLNPLPATLPAIRANHLVIIVMQIIPSLLYAPVFGSPAAHVENHLTAQKRR